MGRPRPPLADIHLMFYAFASADMETEMYEAFDAFCRRRTWDSSHPSDVQVFRAALGGVVRHPGFSPDEMGDYIRQNHAQPIWPKSKAELDKVIRGLVRDAQIALGRVKG